MLFYMTSEHALFVQCVLVPLVEYMIALYQGLRPHYGHMRRDWLFQSCAGTGFLDFAVVSFA